MNTPYQSWILKRQRAKRNHALQVTLHVDQSMQLSRWKTDVNTLAKPKVSVLATKRATESWWEAFWNRSYIVILPEQKDPENEAWQVGRNYQLFRFMLACNAYGNYPTKFNGGLFSYDPVVVDSSFLFTPDFRNWGGGTHTAQNQRLVYWPMLKSGDFDMLPAQFKFYQRILKNAEWRSRVYWGHGGASFTEQIENFGLPNPAEY